MALSKLQKGLVGLGIAVVAVIAVGYGGMRYLENAVVDAIRTWGGPKLHRMPTWSSGIFPIR